MLHIVGERLRERSLSYKVGLRWSNIVDLRTYVRSYVYIKQVTDQRLKFLLKRNDDYALFACRQCL